MGHDESLTRIYQIIGQLATQADMALDEIAQIAQGEAARRLQALHEQREIPAESEAARARREDVQRWQTLAQTDVRDTIMQIHRSLRSLMAGPMWYGLDRRAGRRTGA